MAMRWKKKPKPTGLAGVGAGPSGSSLHENGKVFATVNAARARHVTTGWYWVAGWDSDIPHMNTCNDLLADEVTAKAAAMAYVKAELAKLAAMEAP